MIRVRLPNSLLFVIREKRPHGTTIKSITQPTKHIIKNAVPSIQTQVLGICVVPFTEGSGNFAKTSGTVNLLHMEGRCVERVIGWPAVTENIHASEKFTTLPDMRADCAPAKLPQGKGCMGSSERASFAWLST